MSQQPSGWYSDPSNPDQLRYWDGVAWTDHTTSRAATTSPPAGPPMTPPPASAGPQQMPPTTPTPWGGGGGMQQYPQARGLGYEAMGPTTVDGVDLATWGQRFGAWFIDGLIFILPVGIVQSWILGDSFTQISDEMTTAVETNDSTGLETALVEATGPLLVSQLVAWILISLYCIFFWTRSGQTPGKKALGISVRLAERPGPLSVGDAVKRRIVPLVWQFVSLVFLLDYLWPLWDSKRQALHDKVAGTQVVVGKQPQAGSIQQSGTYTQG